MQIPRLFFQNMGFNRTEQLTLESVFSQTSQIFLVQPLPGPHFENSGLHTTVAGGRGVEKQVTGDEEIKEPRGLDVR